MEAMVQRGPLGGVLGRAELERLLDDVNIQAPNAVVRWDGATLTAGMALDLLRRYSCDEVVALMLMDGRRLALSLSSRRPYLDRIVA